MPREADRVSQVSTSTGSGNLVLGSAVSGYRTFTAAFGSGNTDVNYGIFHAADGSWENGIGVFLGGSNALQRDLATSSSSGGGKISFAAGNKIVYINPSAERALIARIRRPGDVGVDIIPASGQTADMLRVQNSSGGTAAAIQADGTLYTATQVEVSNAAPTVRFVEGSNLWRIRLDSNVLSFQRSTSGDFATVATPFSLSSSGVTGLTLAAGTDLTAPSIVQSSASDGALIATISSVAPWRFLQRGTGSSADLEIGPQDDGTLFRIASASGLSGFRFRPDTSTVYTTNSDHTMKFRAAGGNGFWFYTQWADGASVDAQIVPGGSAATVSNVIMTREKGDARYQLSSSSANLKLDIAPLALVDTTVIQPKTWVWDMDGHPRNGMSGAGFIAEEIETAFPEAYLPPTDDTPAGIDLPALLAVFVASTRAALADHDARLIALEAA